MVRGITAAGRPLSVPCPVLAGDVVTGQNRDAYLREINRCRSLELDCIHGYPGGDIVRPWAGTPGCPYCRRRHPVHWRVLGDPWNPK